MRTFTSKNYDWRKLPVILKRFSLQHKLAWCSHFAAVSCGDWRYDAGKLKGVPHPLPWELNTIAMLSLCGQEYDCQDLDQHKFYRIVNAVRTATPFKKGDDFDSVMNHFVVRAQFFYQTDVRVFLSRYRFIFAHSAVRLEEVVEERLGVPYRNILGMAVCAWAMGINGESFVDVLNGLSRNRNVDIELLNRSIGPLCMDHEDFAQAQSRKIELSPRGYILADNLLEQYPYVRVQEGIVLPLPYLLKNAVTVGVLHRITSGENVGLRAEIGKKVLEDYVVQLMRHADFYDEVFSERMYQRNGKNSPDVIAYRGDKCVLMEVKFKEPTLRLRSLDPEDERDLDDACANAVVQVYTGIKDRAQYLKERIFSAENVFGLVVLFEEPNLSRGRVFERLKILHPELSVDELAYIRRHIRIISLYDVEVMSARHHGMFDVLDIYLHGDESRLYDRSFSLLDEDAESLDVYGFDDLMEYAEQGIKGLFQERKSA